MNFSWIGIRRRQQAGVALIAALILMLALVITLANIFYRHQIDVTRVTKALHADQAFLLALSAETWAAQALSSEFDDREVDSLDENWAQAVPLLPVEGGFVQGCMLDLQGRFNLASFSTYNSDRWANEMENSENSNGLLQSWLNLLRLNELPANESLVAAIIDWVDADSDPVNQWGSEQSDYDADRSLRQVPNSIMTDVEELAVVGAYDINMLRQLRPWISALPQATGININTAAETVLYAIGNNRGEDFVNFVLAGRPFRSVDEFQQAAADHFDLEPAQAAAFWPNELISVNSDYFLLQLRVSLGETELEVSSVLSRYGRDEAVVIRRSLAFIPNILPDPDANNAEPEPGFCEQANLNT